MNPPHDHGTEKPPSQNLDAERGVVGSMLRDNNCIAHVAGRLTVDSFYADAHRKVFSAIVRLSNRGLRADLPTVAEELKQAKQIEDIGYPYLAELWEAAPTAANVEYYTDAVKEAAKRRTLARLAEGLLRDAHDPAGPADDIIADAEMKLADLREIGGGSGTKTLDEALDLAISRIDERTEGTGRFGVKTGFKELDLATGGLQNGELTILAARTSQGKSSLAANIAMNVWLGSKIPILFATLEQKAADLGERILCAEGGISTFRTRAGKTSADDTARISETWKRLKGGKVFFLDRPGLTVTSIAAEARQLHRKHGRLLCIVDYMQLVEAELRGKATRQEQVAAVSRRLKNLAGELGIPVLSLSQLNREADGERPRLSHLRESGAIEQDADTVLLLHKEPGNSRLVTCIIAKQRNGPTGEVSLTFRQEFMRFEDWLP